MRSIALLAASAGFVLAAAAAADATACPYRVRGFAALPDGKSYAVRLSARDLYTGDLRLVIWSSSKRYALELPKVTIDQAVPTMGPRGQAIEGFPPQYITAPVRIVELPAPDVILAMRLERSNADGRKADFDCSAQLSVPYSRKILDVPERYRSQYLNIEQSLVREAVKPGVARAVATDEASLTPVTCDAPFVESAMLDPKQPRYPDQARRERAMGVVTIDVRLASTGAVQGAFVLQSSGSPSLDAVALEAARESTYRSEMFRCEQQPSESSSSFSFSGG